MNSNDFKLTEPVILAFEKEKEDSHLLKKYRRTIKFKKKYFILMIRLILIIALLYSSIYLYTWYKNTQDNNKMIETVNSYITIKNNIIDEHDAEEIDSQTQSEEFKVDFDGLNQINSSCFGWIKVNNTNISFPITKYTNNEYYLSHSFDYSKNSAGWIFADYRNACDGYDKNLIIYGHNMRNGTMFSELNNCLDKNWYTNDDNKVITIYTPCETLNYEIFSIYSIKAESYYTITSFLSDSVYESFLNKLKSRSIYNFNVDLTSEDRILTLSTCSNTNSDRTVIHAKKVSN